MRIARFVLALFLLAAANAGAQEVSTAIVPVVGSVDGPSNIRWLTDVELTNQTSLGLDVAIELPTVPDAPLFLFTLAPGQSQRFTDVFGQAFGLEAGLSPLRVTTGARHSVNIRAAAYAVNQGDGSVSAMQPIFVYAENTWYPTRILDGLAFSDETRTNIGLLNFGDEPAHFVLALQKVPGRDLAVSHIRVGPGSLSHTSLQSLFPLISKGSGFSVVVETAERDTHVYGSVIDSATNAAVFVVPRIGIR
jgi:hypothetical protein